MKLIICLECMDVFNLTKKNKTCGCGESSGKYIDNLNAPILQCGAFFVNLMA